MEQNHFAEIILIQQHEVQLSILNKVFNKNYFYKN